MISKETVQHVAKLARIGITQKEEEKFAKDLSSVLDYFEKLKEVDTSKIEPTTHSVIVENVYREDKTVGTESDTKNNLREAAPDKKGGFIKVKSIF